MTSSLFDLAEELVLQPYKQGIKINRPDAKLGKNVASAEMASSLSIAEIFKFPVNVYFLDQESIVRGLNEYAVICSGFLTKADAIGKSSCARVRPEYAKKIIDNDREVITTQRMRLFAEEVVLVDNLLIPAVSFKFPWYGSDNKPIGVFGCSIILNDLNCSKLVEEISAILQLGLLTATANFEDFFKILPVKKIGNVCLSLRESQCLSLLVKGKTTKMIAQTLSLSPRTIESYLENIKLKLNVRTKAELIEKAMSLLGNL